MLDVYTLSSKGDVKISCSLLNIISNYGKLAT